MILPTNNFLLLLIIIYCIAESTVYAYTDRPYLVIPVYMPCRRGPDKVKPVNGHSSTPYLHLETIKTARKHFLVFEVHEDESCAIQQDPMGLLSRTLFGHSL